MAELLMEELLAQLSERKKIKKMLGEMTGLPVASLIKKLIADFEQVVAKYHRESLEVDVEERADSSASYSEPFTQTDLPSIPLRISHTGEVPGFSVRELPPQQVPAEEVFPAKPGKGEKKKEHQEQAPTQKETPPEPVRSPEPSAKKIVEPQDERPASVHKIISTPEENGDTDVNRFRERLEAVAKRVENEYLEKLEEKKKSRVEDTPGESQVIDQKPAETIAEVEKSSPAAEVVEEEFGPAEPHERGRASRIPYRLDERDYLYIHGAMEVPSGEPGADLPFMLEEKGIDSKEFAFALDHDGLRFFLSRVNQSDMSVSRKGLLLLGKQESLQLRGQHESILNDLRAHGLVLPFEFGTVARGRDELLQLADQFRADISSALQRLQTTKWWTIGLHVLDARIAQLFASESSLKEERSGRERERMSYTAPLQQKKYDVKLLERILQKEKRLAESVHDELGSHAERSEIQTIVGLGSGSSDDWKLILKSSYYVDPTSVHRFTRTVTDLQYRHILFEPMFALTGDAEFFSFARK